MSKSFSIVSGVMEVLTLHAGICLCYVSWVKVAR